MLLYSNEQLATIIGVPLVTLLIIWTLTIFHKNRKTWNSYDVAIVAILVQSILRNLTILCYTALVIAKANLLTVECCRVIVWIFNSVHTFQASSLTTLAVIALFTVKLYRKQETLQQYLTPTHVIYHLFCLTTLCACVGVASILAQEDAESHRVFCNFMPFDLDIKYNIFIIVLHVFLATVSFGSFLIICSNHVKMRKQGFEYLKKSTSDLSDLSMSLTGPNENVKGYYDTYTIHRGQLLNHYEVPSQIQNVHAWNSDLSNISTTVSSTNSKRPCLNKSPKEEGEVETGMQTMYPVLLVCYVFNHLPLIVMCIFPRLVLPWPVSGVALWMGQLQDVLIPLGLGIVDSRFCKWVSHVYKCTERRRTTEKIPPGVGLDGKFRHFGSQPQSLEVSQPITQRDRQYAVTEHKFPITNGSLYTSIDGRLPIIHNYRRHKDQRQKIITQPQHAQSVNIHSSHLQRPHKIPTTCDNHQQNMYLSHITQQYSVQHVCQDPAYFRGPQKRVLQKHISRSQDTLDTLDVMNDLIPGKTRLNRQNLVRNKRGLVNRISKSEDSLNDLQKDLLKFKENPELFQVQHKHGSISSDDEYFIDYDGTSQSSYSITTEANCDFEFYQNKEIDFLKVPNERLYDASKKPPQCLNRTNSKCSSTELNNVSHRQRITRSNSKRSLENFQAFIEEESDPKIQRSSSFMTVEDQSNAFKYMIRRVNPKQKPIKHDNLKNVLRNENGIKVKPVVKNNVQGGSIPDFKKVFISDYI